jgi:hypothetical protein
MHCTDEAVAEAWAGADLSALCETLQRFRGDRVLALHVLAVLALAARDPGARHRLLTQHQAMSAIARCSGRWPQDVQVQVGQRAHCRYLAGGD